MPDKKFCINCKWCSYNRPKGWWKMIFPEEIEEARCFHHKAGGVSYDEVSGAKIEYQPRCSFMRKDPAGACFHGDLWESKT